MKRILFVCHGNICRSPMAEEITKHYVKQAGRSHDFEIASAAVSDEEWMNPIYPPAARTLRGHGVPYDPDRTARKIKAGDYERYDLILAMDSSNVRGILDIVGNGDPEGKVKLLLDFTGESRNVADPWYTRDFEAAWRDIDAGCRALCSKFGIL